jgi:hypothetical protein
VVTEAMEVGAAMEAAIAAALVALVQVNID